ncbi:MAG: YcxB family protein [Chloroflexales bacterium]
MPVFNYNVKTEDLVELSLNRLRGDPSAQLQARGLQLLVPFAIFLASIGTVYLLDADKQLTPLDWVVPCVLGVAMVVLFPRRFETNLRKRLAAQFGDGQGSDLVGKHTANILPTMIVQSARGREIRAAWTAIDQITIAAAHIFVFVDDSQAFVIPRQGFADPRQYEQAKALVTQYQRADSNTSLTPR